MKKRTERDLLGEREIPNDVYYGIQTLRAVENFPITGQKVQKELIIAMAMVKKAAALANMDIGCLQNGFGTLIVKVSDEIISGNLHEQFVVDPIQGGAGTSINMNMNEVIANRGLEIMGKEKGDYFHFHPTSVVNMSQSTNDTVPTANHIAILSLLENLLETMHHMHNVFDKLSKEFDGIIKMGRTHLQDAVPIRLGQEFKAYSKVIERDIYRIDNASKRLLEINMGATAVGTGLNAHPKYIENVVQQLKNISTFPLVRPQDLVDATQNTDAYTEVSASLKVCMINMSKIANDLRLMASGPRTGFNEIMLPERQPGSSIMPGKVNPVIPELINQIAYQVIGNDGTISHASEAGQFEINVMEPVLIYNLLQSVTIMNNAFRTFTDHCLVGIQANKDKLTKDVENSVGIITAVNPHIGYDIVSQIAREAIVNKESVRNLCLKYDVLTEDELNEILDPYEMTHQGIAGEHLLYRDNQ